jgi:transposase-like protein
MVGGIVDRDKENRWRELIEQQKRSGKSQSEFCKELGLRDNQFSYWKKAFIRRSKKQIHSPKKKTTPPFVSLKLPEPIICDNKSDFNLAQYIEINKITVRISKAEENILACILRSLG